MNTHAARILVAVALALGASGCVGGADPGVSHVSHPDEISNLPLVQLIEGEFDGQDFHFQTVEPERVMDVGQAAGVSIEALTSLSSCSGSSCMGNYVYLTNGAFTYTAPWADTAHCGTSPSGSGGNLGICRSILVRSTFTNQLERVYIRFSTLTPTAPTTAVSFAAPNPYSASVDFGVAAPGVSGGLRRVGELPAAQTSGGVSQFWGFSGTTTGTSLQFRFVVEVYGIQARATTQTSSAVSSVAISEDGTTTVSSLNGTGGLLRHLMSGGDTTVLTGCSISPPTVGGTVSVSGNGSMVAFAATGGASCSLPAISGLRQIYVYDFSSGTATLVSHADGDPTTRGNGVSQNPRINNDGTVVVYQSTATNLTPTAPTVTCNEVYRYDIFGDITDHVSGPNGAPVGADFVSTCTLAGARPDVSGDGNLVIFASAENLDGGDTNGTCDAYVYDYNQTNGLGVMTTYRVSSSGIEGGANCVTGVVTTPAISVDGAFVVFSSASSGNRAIYRRSSSAGADPNQVVVTHAPGSTTEVSGITSLSSAGISSTGRFVSFVANATALANDSHVLDTWPGGGTTQQLYVCDLGAVDASLNRCFVASSIYSGDPASVAFQSTAPATNTRPSLAYSDPNGAGYAAYQVGSTAWVSPVGDPRYQQSEYAP